MIERQPDMIVVGEVLDPLQLLSTSRQNVVDVIIITPLNANGEPKICHLLLVEHPHLLIVTQSKIDNAVCLYQSGVQKKSIDNPSELSLLGIIRKIINANHQFIIKE